MIKAIIDLLNALPEIIKLLKILDEKNKQRQIDAKIKDDIKAINKAFKEKDAEALNRIFNDGSA
jgi:hypothetical protein